MTSLLILFAVIIIAYLGGIWAFRVRRFSVRLQPFFISGIEFIILGICLGPHIFGLVTDQRLEVLRPLISILTGWIGLVFGLQFNFRALRVLPRSNYIISIIQAIFTLIFVCILFLLVFHFAIYPITDLWSYIPLVVTLGAAASVSSPSVIAAVGHHIRANGTVTRLLRYVSSIDGVVGIVAFGLVSPFFHGHLQLLGLDIFDPWQWILFSLFLSIMIGFLFHMLMLPKQSDTELLALLIGILIFSCGACYFLYLSPLFVNFLVGVILANLSTSRDSFYRILILKEKPLYILLLVLAGTLYETTLKIGIVLGILYVCIRIISKIVGSALALSFYTDLFRHPSRFGIGLIPQGGITLAIGIDYYFIYQEWSARLLLNMLVISFFINALISPVAVKRLLVREGEVECVS